MSKRVTKIISLVLIIILVFSTFAFAAGARASLYLKSYTASTSAQGNGIVRVSFTVGATGLMDNVGASIITLQYSFDNSTWYTETTFYSSSTSGMIRSNSANYTSYVEYSGISGLYYRAFVTVYASNSNGSDTAQIYAGSIKAT